LYLGIFHFCTESRGLVLNLIVSPTECNHVCIFAYVELSLTICYFGIRKNAWIRSYFWPVTVDSVGVSCYVAFSRKGIKLVIFFIACLSCVFWEASLKILQSWFLKNWKLFTKFLWNSPIPLLHPSRLVGSMRAFFVQRHALSGELIHYFASQKNWSNLFVSLLWSQSSPRDQPWLCTLTNH